MKKSFRIRDFLAALILYMLSPLTHATTYYGSDVSMWQVVDNSPAGASVSSSIDPIIDLPAIKTSGAGTQNSYIVGGFNTSTGWNNQSEHWITWRMRTNQSFNIYLRVDTLHGAKFLRYNQSNTDYLSNSSGNTIHHGLGSESTNGTWQYWSRNLAADVKNANPTNEIIAVQGFLVRGNLSVTDINLSSPIVYSDAEDGSTDGWRITDRTPTGADIINTQDEFPASNRTIKFNGSGILNSFTHGHANATLGWGNSDHKNISWRSKSNSDYRAFVRVTTPLGWRYLWYDSRTTDRLANNSGRSIHHGLGSNAMNGNWHSFVRNLDSDLKDAEPNNSITTVDAFIIRGNVTIDDVTLGGVVQSSTTSSQPINPPDMPTIDDYELVFNDEFDGTNLDGSKWQTSLIWGPYLPINGEQQLYVDTLGINQNSQYSPFTLTGDTLKISATPVSGTVQPPERPSENDAVWQQYPEYRFNADYNAADVEYLSGVISSYDSFKMTHGYVEARVKMPAGQGLWPAFWLLNTHYVEDSPEIDVVEFHGQNETTVYHTYHYFDTSDGWQKISTPTFETNGPNWTESFHNFGLKWSPTELIWYVDGEEVQRITDSEYVISKQAMYLIANLAVGGSWPGPADETTPFPAEYEIDYIRAYKKKQNSELDLQADYQLMFNDEFDGLELDSTKWNTSFLWGPYFAINNEEHYYIDIFGSDSDSSYSPFSLSNGVLTITADLSSNSPSDTPPPSLPGPNEQIWQDNPQFQQGPYPAPPDYTSGIITSYDSFKFVNGYAEIRARVPDGDGLWPAFWLLNAYYVGPLPEIDIMEIVGESPNIAYHTFHRSNESGYPLQTQYTSQHSTGYSDGFHTYGVRWNPGEITWYVDGQVVDTYTESDPSKNNAYQLMYVIANLAVGGNFNTQSVDVSALPAQYDIDYIRVYQEN